MALASVAEIAKDHTLPPSTSVQTPLFFGDKSQYTILANL